MNKKDYNAEYERITAELGGERPGLLLHVCCAPCMSAGIVSLASHFRVAAYFYNPNIFPEEEYDKRLGEVKRLIAALGYDIPVIAEAYDRAEYDRAVGELKGTAEHGAKCLACIADRLEKTTARASADGYDYFATTLTSSPLKDAAFINETGLRLAGKYGVRFLPSDFKKKGGGLRIKETCEKYGIYRQRYCGCTPPRLVVAVTGGIASGKSAFTGMLAALGAYTIDADAVTRELQSSGPVLERVLREFPSAARADGTLDRAALREEVFASDERRRALEGIMHPAVGEEIARRVRASDAKVTVMEVPLLFECGMESMADVTVNVTAPYALREKRAAERSGLTPAAFAAVAAAQLSDEERAARADVTVVNDGDTESLRRRAEELMNSWLDRLK